MRNQIIIWCGFAVVLLLLPQVFSSFLALSVLNQMAIAVIFALSYNMLLGQGGMLSFGHAVYFGLGGFLSVHAMNYIADNGVAIPIVFVPLLGGIFGFLAALFIGSFSTRKAGTVFAMISLGVGELIAASSIIFVSFFGGEAGVQTDRTLAPAFFGIDFARDIQVYYLAAGWVLIATALMYLFTRTPAGRIANAVRDNPERAEFIGYSARMVRFISFCFSGFFAGIAGGLVAINYEILTEENLNAITSGSVLLMVYIGGMAYFFGPIIGAVILTLIQSLLSFYTDLHLLYVGILFILTVMFLPRGFAGVLMMHQRPWNEGRTNVLIVPYLVTGIPAAILVVSLIGILEMWHTNASTFNFVGFELSPTGVGSWVFLIGLALGSLVIVKLTSARLMDAWQRANGLEGAKS